tara:strand:- start:1398 stop:2108 length:711 start_codon:yes stop_codon:yes gene_type:complete
MSAPNYVGETDWQRQPGGSFGYTQDGLQFREIVYRGRIDTAGQFINAWPKGSSSPLSSEGHLNLTSTPTVNDENGVSGISTLRFEGVSGSSEEANNESEEWTHEIKEIVLQPSNDVLSVGKYSYLSPHVVYTYQDDHKRDMDPMATRFKHPAPWGAGFKDDEEIQDIMGPHFLVEFTDKLSRVKVVQLKADHKIVGTGPFWEIKQVSGFTSISRSASDVYTHSEIHFLVLEPTGNE